MMAARRDRVTRSSLYCRARFSRFATVSATTDGHASATNLLPAAEIAFARRGIESALVVCPAAWISKRAVLAHNGYRTAKLWMLKR